MIAHGRNNRRIKRTLWQSHRVKGNNLEAIEDYYIVHQILIQLVPSHYVRPQSLMTASTPCLHACQLSPYGLCVTESLHHHATLQGIVRFVRHELGVASGPVDLGIVKGGSHG